MGELQETMAYLTNEIITSKARSPYPYVLLVGSCARFDSGKTANAEIGIYAKMTSEAFGDVASASDQTVEGALLKLCRELQSSRVARQLKESRVQEKNTSPRSKRSIRNRVTTSQPRG